MTLTKRFSIVCTLCAGNQPSMAQKSKKNHIIQTALPLFLEHGFKGTSIDLVVKTSRVSKPTVYNHFPDKKALMLATMEQWITDNQPQLPNITSKLQLLDEIAIHWLKPQTIYLYALVIGEGRRFANARKLFWEKFDEPWRLAFVTASTNSGILTTTTTDLILDQTLLRQLKQL